MTPPRSAKPAAKKAAPKAAPTDEERLEAAKAKADEGAPPAKRATKLKVVHPELADPAWVAGNQAAAERLGG